MKNWILIASVFCFSPSALCHSDLGPPATVVAGLRSDDPKVRATLAGLLMLNKHADLNAGRFAVEVRNKEWLDARPTDLLGEHNVGLALTDTSFMPRPWEMKGSLDLVTADLAYVRWLGNRKSIEEKRLPGIRR